jgi:hypothetical protein
MSLLGVVIVLLLLLMEKVSVGGEAVASLQTLK